MAATLFLCSQEGSPVFSRAYPSKFFFYTFFIVIYIFNNLLLSSLCSVLTRLSSLVQTKSSTVYRSTGVSSKRAPSVALAIVSAMALVLPVAEKHTTHV